MACAGRQKTCSVVPSNHFGPIPGVEVGQSWKFRVGVGIIPFIFELDTRCRNVNLPNNVELLHAS